MQKTLFTLLLLVYSAQLLASQKYQANFEESKWMLKASPIRCELTHPIPRYGRGNFVYSSNGELAFSLDVLQPPVQDGVASMASVPSFWKAGSEGKSIGEFSISAGKTPIYAPHKIALRILYELDAGMFPVLQYKDWADQRDAVSVALSPVNFRDVLPAFQQCISQLLPYSFDDLKESTVLFNLNKSTLTVEAKQILENLSLFAKEYKNVNMIIEGHTDNIGSRYYNQQLSRQRALSVKKFLLDKGVPAKRVILKGFGERKPVASNRTEEGRAVNRRVNVTLNVVK
ncbi:MAG: OmpA family protein [Gammaproteobacteria bacterium]|nr:OmpA family protein [Gammaproteobacteria bacterium]